MLGTLRASLGLPVQKYYFQTRSDVVGKPYGDITSRVALRKRLGCRSFDWYMKTVYPELQLPSKDGPKRSKKQRNKALQRNLKRKMPAILGRFQVKPCPDPTRGRNLIFALGVPKLGPKTSLFEDIRRFTAFLIALYGAMK